MFLFTVKDPEGLFSQSASYNEGRVFYINTKPSVKVKSFQKQLGERTRHLSLFYSSSQSHFILHLNRKQNYNKVKCVGKHF